MMISLKLQYHKMGGINTGRVTLVATCSAIDERTTQSGRWTIRFADVRGGQRYLGESSSCPSNSSTTSMLKQYTFLQDGEEEQKK